MPLLSPKRRRRLHLRQLLFAILLLFPLAVGGVARRAERRRSEKVSPSRPEIERPTPATVF
jgi:hypothetical protein